MTETFSFLLGSQGKVTSISLHLEISSVLFNTAVLFMTHGNNAYKEGSGGSEVCLECLVDCWST